MDELSNFLAEQFSPDELKGMAFDLGLALGVLAQQTRDALAAGLVQSCQELAQNRQLLARVIADRPAAPKAFGELLAELEPGQPRRRVVAGLPPRLLRADQHDLAAAIAGLLPDISAEEVAVMAISLVEEQVLLGLPTPAAEALLQGGPTGVQNGGFQVGSVESYEDLEPAERSAWRGRALETAGPAGELSQLLALLQGALERVRQTIGDCEDDETLLAVLGLNLEAIKVAERLGPAGSAINRNEILYLSLRSRESREQQLQVLRALERSLVENIKRAQVLLEGYGGGTS